VVLDACALIAYLNGEEGADQVETLFRSGKQVQMSCVNLLEVAYNAIKASQNPDAAEELMEEISKLPISVIWDVPMAVFLEASRLKASYRISLADAVAAAFSRIFMCQLATSDHHKFDHLDSIKEIQALWIR
jgi:PIN domain nuclease of toxin-antitoxin system